jgi:hypothetical protein
MKRFKQLCVATVLTITLAFTTFAGEMDTMRVPPPPSQATSAGEMGTMHTTSALEIALSLIQSVLSLI